jgi:hypothetical protein
MTTSQWIEQAKTTLGNLVAVDVATRDARSRLIAEVPTDWISVKDGLPELGVAVLVTDGTTQSTAERRNPYTNEDKDGIRWRCNVVSGFEWDWELDDDYRDQSPITHWMPLPKPPEPE